MDNKKAIDLLSMIEFEHAECCLNTWYKGIDDDMKEALEMAIKALEQERCGDATSRQAVLEQINCWIGSGEYRYTNATDYLNKRITSLPSISTEKTGRWIAQDIHNCHTDFKCSECGYIHSFMHLYGEPTADYTYCPNCGARMEVEDG